MRLCALHFAIGALLFPALASAQNYGSPREPSAVILPASHGWRNYVSVADDSCGCTVPVRADCYDHTCKRCGIRPFCILHRFARSLDCLFPCNRCRNGCGSVHGSCAGGGCSSCGCGGCGQLGMSSGPCGPRFMASCNNGLFCESSCQSCCKPSRCSCKTSCCEKSCITGCDAPTCSSAIPNKGNPFQDDPPLIPLPAPTSSHRPLIPPVPVPSLDTEANFNPVLRPLARPSSSGQTVVLTRPSRAPLPPWKISTASVTNTIAATPRAENKTAEVKTQEVKPVTAVVKIEMSGNGSPAVQKIEVTPARAESDKKEVSVLRRTSLEVEVAEPEALPVAAAVMPVIRLEHKRETLPESGVPVNPLR